jgi:hypothetical protein
VYVALDQIPLELGGATSRVELGLDRPEPLQADTGRLEPVEGADLILSDTIARVRAARELIGRNRQQALRGLTAALYRAYAREAQTQRQLQERELESSSANVWTAAHDRISALLQEHAGDRFPLSSRLSLLIGFPFHNPAIRVRPENPVDAKQYDESVRLWERLLAEDKEFAAKVEAILDEVQTALDARRVQIQVDFAKALNAAADRSTAEAAKAIESRLPDFVGTLAQRSDIRIPPLPAESMSLPPVPAPSIRLQTPDRPLGQLRRELLEQDLQIWLAQKGYVRARSPLEGPDRTQEFAAWIKARKAGV